MRRRLRVKVEFRAHSPVTQNAPHTLTIPYPQPPHLTVGAWLGRRNGEVRRLSMTPSEDDHPFAILPLYLVTLRHYRVIRKLPNLAARKPPPRLPTANLTRKNETLINDVRTGRRMRMRRKMKKILNFRRLPPPFPWQIRILKMDWEFFHKIPCIETLKRWSFRCRMSSSSL